MNSEPATIDMVRDAARRLEGVAVKTPLLESPLLNAAVGRRVLVKAECLQRTGSFKFRGAWSRLTAEPKESFGPGIVAFSSGNHAQGVAHAATMLEIPSTIIMPDDAPALKKANTAAYGGQVVTYDRAGGASREALGEKYEREQGLTLVKPFEDPWVIAGQGSAGLEIAAQARAVGVEQADVAICTGGGGLASGVALALESEAPSWKVRPVEPEGFDDWRRSLRAGERETNAAPTGSICDAILTPSPGEGTWAIGKRLFGAGLAVSDLDARRAMAAAFRHLKLVIEPGGAVALAAALTQPAAFAGDAIIVIATGGNVDYESFTAWTRFSWLENGLPGDVL